MHVTATTDKPTVRLPWLGTLWTRTRAAQGLGFKAGWLAVMLGAVVVLAFAGLLWLALQAARWVFKPGKPKAFELRDSPDHGRRALARTFEPTQHDEFLDGRHWMSYEIGDPRRTRALLVTDTEEDD